MPELLPAEAILITGGPMVRNPAVLAKPPVSHIQGVYKLADNLLVDAEGALSAPGTIIEIRGSGDMAKYQDGIQSFMRSRLHIGYWADGLQLPVDMSVRFASSALQYTWFAEDKDEAALNAYASSVASIRRLLKDSSHRALLEVLELCERGSTMHDIRDRFNSPSRSAIVMAIRRRLELMRDHLQNVRDEADELTQAVFEELKRTMLVIMLVEREIMEISRWWMIPGKLEQVLRGDRAERLARRLRVCADVLGNVIVRPFAQLCYRMAEDLRIMAGLLDQKLLDRASIPLLRVMRSQVIPQMLIDMHGVTTLTSMAERWPQIEVGPVEARVLAVNTGKLIECVDKLNDSDWVRPISGDMRRQLLIADEAFKHLSGSNLLVAKNAMVEAMRVAAPIPVAA